jgi:hypothetical protein
VRRKKQRAFLEKIGVKLTTPSKKQAEFCVLRRRVRTSLERYHY